MITFLFSLAFSAPTTSLDLDMDGNGKAEAIRVDAEAGVVRIGRKIQIPCSADGCDVEAHDISSKTPGKEVAICEHGPRDDVSCTLVGLEKGKLITYQFPDENWGAVIHTSGNGIVLRKAGYAYRLFEQTFKYRVQGTQLIEVRQPAYLAPAATKMHIDRTFKLLLDPKGTAVVGYAKPDSDILVLGAHGSVPGFLLVRLSSGISGYVSPDELEKASDHYRMMMGAG